MTARQLVRHRLFNQHIAETQCRTPAEVVAALGAVQAQDYLGALWSIGLRLPQATETGIEEAIADRSIIRTWPMRGTLHFVAAADVRWMLQLMTPRIMARAAGRHRQLELDAKTFSRARKLIERKLRGGKVLSRPTLFDFLEKSGISPKGQRGIHIMIQLAQEGLICFGPREGKQFTFTLLDEWLPKSRMLGRDAALAEIALRYFTGHGPATFADFVGWTGLKVPDAKAGLDAVSSKLTKEVVDGVTYWMPQSALSSPKPSSALHLLPGFDEYILGYKDRSATVEAQHSQKVAPGKNGMFMPTIVSDGLVIGLWKRTFQKKGVVISANPFMPLKKTQSRTFEIAAERYAKFLGKEVVEG